MVIHGLHLKIPAAFGD